MQTASGASVTEKPHFTVQAVSPKEMFICLPNIHLHININAHHVGFIDLKCFVEMTANGATGGTGT